MNNKNPARSKLIATLVTNIVLRVIPWVIVGIAGTAGFYYNTINKFAAHAENLQIGKEERTINKEDIKTNRDDIQEWRTEQRLLKKDVTYIKDSVDKIAKAVE